MSERLDHMRSGGQNVPELMILPIYSQLPSDLQVGLLGLGCESPEPLAGWLVWALDGLQPLWGCVGTACFCNGCAQRLLNFRRLVPSL